MNLQDSKASLIFVVFLFIQSTLSTPCETGRETNYNLYNHHQGFTTPFECGCHWEDVSLPEVTFHSPNIEISPPHHNRENTWFNEYADSFLIDLHSRLYEKYKENNNNDNSDNRQVDLDQQLGQPELSENNDNNKLPELDARSKPHLNKENDEVEKPALTFEEFKETIDKRSHARGYLQIND